jgi:hypothetical protein
MHLASAREIKGGLSVLGFSLWLRKEGADWSLIESHERTQSPNGDRSVRSFVGTNNYRLPPSLREALHLGKGESPLLSDSL